MHKKGRIIAGLIIFIAIITLQFLYNLEKNKNGNININTPRIRELRATQCIELTEYMRANLMKLLVQCRDKVVRGGERIYVNCRGESYIKEKEDSL